MRLTLVDTPKGMPDPPGIERPPCFLVGAEYSGLERLEAMVGAHPAMAWCGGFEYAVSALDHPTHWPVIGEYLERLERDRQFGAADFAVDPRLSYPELLNSFLAQACRRNDAPVPGASCRYRFERLARIWPDAKFVYLVRDPRDSAAAAVASGWAGNAWHGVEPWLEAERSWCRLEDQVSARNRCRVRFEDLLCNTSETLRRICTVFDIPFDTAMLLSAQHLATFDDDLPGWREALRPWEVQCVEARAGEAMERHGYRVSDYPYCVPSPSQRFLLRLQNRLRRVITRVRTYGWRLWLSELIARRGGFRRWMKESRRRMNLGR